MTLPLIILPVKYGCKTWSLTFREKNTLRAFENRKLMKIFWAGGVGGGGGGGGSNRMMANIA